MTTGIAGAIWFGAGITVVGEVWVPAGLEVIDVGSVDGDGDKVAGLEDELATQLDRTNKIAADTIKVPNNLPE